MRCLDDPEAQSGREVLLSAVEHARTQWGDRLVAAYAIGSLAHGGFAPAVSDADLALILMTLEGSDPAAMQAVKEKVVADLETSLSRRLSIFWSCPTELRSGTARGRLPLVDRLDLREHGALLFGTEVRDQVTVPVAGAIPRLLILEAAAFMLDKLADPDRDVWFNRPGKLLALGPRELTKAVLFPVRFLYTLEQGRPGTNAEAVAWYLSHETGPSRALAAAAFRWRHEASGVETAEAELLLRDGLRPLYVELLSRYAARLREWDESALAARLQAWQVRLTRLASR